MQNIKKAIIPCAGLGTRVLPLTKGIPKEMIPIVDKPTIHYIVEEAVNSGIKDILIVISRGKEIIENYFDVSPELENQLLKKEKFDILNGIKDISKLANIYFIRQKYPKGLGDAVLCGKSFIGNEPFAVLNGDDVIISKKPVILQLIEAYKEYGLGVIGAKQMPETEIHKYGSLKIEHIKNNIFKCTDMIEKPTKNQVMSLYSILGRFILPSEIFQILENTPFGIQNELQLTDAMKTLANTKGMTMVDFDGKRYDMGNKFGIMQASIEVALNHAEIGDSFRKYLKSMCSNI